jgi:hypothetical protein
MELSKKFRVIADYNLEKFCHLQAELLSLERASEVSRAEEQVLDM